MNIIEIINSITDLLFLKCNLFHFLTDVVEFIHKFHYNEQFERWESSDYCSVKGTLILILRFKIN